jgi:perosamine synthetase
MNAQFTRSIDMIAISKPMLGPEEIAAVVSVMSSGNIVQGKKVAELEATFAKLFGTTHAVALSSGTAAIHSALHAAGVGPGDEVIVPAFSFVGTVNPVLMVGARPVFVDIGLSDFNLDPAKVAAAIGPKTKAIIPVDLYGQTCDFDAIASQAASRNLTIIEDACQAVGATYKGRPAGSLGDYGCISLYATKNIIAGEGGIVSTNSDVAARSVRSFRQHGLVASGEYDGLGYNYRTTDIAAAIACEQLKKLKRFIDARQRNARLLSEGLAGIRGLMLPGTKAGRTHTYHQFTVRITNDFGRTRHELINRLHAAGVASAVYYAKPLHAFPHVAGNRFKIGDFPVAEQAAREVLSLPVHPGLSERNLDVVIEAIKTASQ